MRDTLTKAASIFSIALLIALTGSAYASPNTSPSAYGQVVAMSDDAGTPRQSDPPKDCKSNPDDPRCKKY